MKRLTLLLFWAATVSWAQSEDKPARLAVVGDATAVLFSQNDFCGQWRDIPSGQFRAIGLTPGAAAWVRVRDAKSSPTALSPCEVTNGFVPDAGQAYILRMRSREMGCTAELFRVVPGADPERVALAPPPTEACKK